MRCDVAANRYAGGLGPPDELERTGGRHVGQVEPRPGDVVGAAGVGDDDEEPPNEALLAKAVAALAPGEATISAVSEGKTGTAKITVSRLIQAITVLAAAGVVGNGDASSTSTVVPPGGRSAYQS